MTAMEIIAILEKLPPDMEVLVEVHPEEHTSYFWNIVDIEVCKLSDTEEQIIGVYLEDELEEDDDIMEINFSLN